MMAKPKISRKKEVVKHKSELEKSSSVIKTSKQKVPEPPPESEGIKLSNSTISLKTSNEIQVFPKTWAGLFNNIELMYTTSVVHIIYHYTTGNIENFLGSLINYCGQLGLLDGIKNLTVKKDEPVLSDIELITLLIDVLVLQRQDSEAENRSKNLGKIFYTISRKYPNGHEIVSQFYKNISLQKKRLLRKGPKNGSN